MIPYSRQSIDEDDIQAVVEVLRSDWLITGPMVEKFEEAVCEFVGGKYGVAVSSGIGALHCTVCAAGIGWSDEVTVLTMIFFATANAAVFQDATPDFAEVDADTLFINPPEVERKVTSSAVRETVEA